jgi:hypothetical protein
MSDKPQLTLRELIQEEYKKCAASPVYFMKHFVKIQHPIRGSILFDLYPFQEQTLQDFADYKFNIILKSRQMGISTLVAAYSLWLMIFNKDKNILLISLKQEDAKEVITKVRFANENLPTWLKMKCLEDNRLSLKYANGSGIKAASTTKKSGVGQALSLLIIDEAGLIDEAEELWTSAQPTLSTGGNAIILSTPRGVGNWFHKMWVGAEEGGDPAKKIGKNGFHPIKLPWHLHPERDQTWRDIEGAKQGNPKKAAQEFDCDFLATGDNVVDLAIIEYYKKTKRCEPVAIGEFCRDLWKWQPPDYNHSYIVSADVARGDGADFSAAHVIDISTSAPTQVAEYKGQMGTKEFGNFLVSLATEYNSALLIIERENIGWAAIQAVIDRGYPNLFYSSADLKYVDVQRQLSNKYDSDDKKIVPGFSTNIKTRPLVIAHLEQFFREKAIEIYSQRTLAELETFIWKNGKAQAMQGYNDDLVMALGIALWVRDTALRLRQEGIDLTRATIGLINRNKIETAPVYKQNQAAVGKKAWEMQTGRQGPGQHGSEDIKWLLG